MVYLFYPLLLIGLIACSPSQSLETDEPIPSDTDTDLDETPSPPYEGIGY